MVALTGGHYCKGISLYIFTLPRIIFEEASCAHFLLTKTLRQLFALRVITVADTDQNTIHSCCYSTLAVVAVDLSDAPTRVVDAFAVAAVFVGAEAPAPMVQVGQLLI